LFFVNVRADIDLELICHFFLRDIMIPSPSN